MNGIDPKTLTPSERTIFRAMLTQTYQGSYNRPAQHVEPTDFHVDLTLASALRAKSVDSWLGHLNYNVAFEWAVQVLARLSEDRVRVPRQYPRMESWEDVVAEARRLVEAAMESERKDQQESLDDEGLEVLRQWHSQSVVTEGKVIDPWGPALSVPVQWFLDNMTLTGVYLVYVAVNNAVQEEVAENLLMWTADINEGRDCAKVAQETFENGIRILEMAIAALAVANAA